LKVAGDHLTVIPVQHTKLGVSTNPQAQGEFLEMAVCH
jgi:hypothetical protein